MKISQKRFNRAAGRLGKRAGKKLGSMVSSYAARKLNRLASTKTGRFLSQFF
jgi:hypothetical protein